MMKKTLTLPALGGRTDRRQTKMPYQYRSSYWCTIKTIAVRPPQYIPARLPLFGRYGALPVSALVGLETFDLSTWSLGVNCVMGFLSIFSLLRPSILDLALGTGQTDGRQPSTLYAPIIGAGA